MVYRPAPVVSRPYQTIPVNYGYTAAPVVRPSQPRLSTIPSHRSSTVINNGWAPMSTDRVVSRF
jgi:hypothetical protein